jgi:hypothetical protein
VNTFETSPTSPLQIITTSDFRFFSTTDPIVANAKLEMNVWDFEVTDEIRCDKWSLLLSGGIRYAHLNQHYDAIDPLGDSFIQSSHGFNGAGPTLALEGRRHIGETGLYLYGYSRGALLFGDSKQDAYAGFLTNGVPSGLDGQAHSFQHPVMPVVELELGAGWQRAMGRGVVFVQGGLVAQCWFNAGNSSRSNFDINQSDDGDATPKDDNLGLIGFSLKAGVNW